MVVSGRLKRARAWWGDRITSIYDGSSTSAPLQGLMWLAAYQEAPQAEYTGIALEYGTLPIMDMMNALRADQWAENHPDAPPEKLAQIKRQTRGQIPVRQSTNAIGSKQSRHNLRFLCFDGFRRLFDIPSTIVTGRRSDCTHIHEYCPNHAQLPVSEKGM